MEHIYKTKDRRVEMISIMYDKIRPINEYES